MDRSEITPASSGREKKPPKAARATPLKDMPENLWVKCAKCKELLYTRDLEKNMRVCPRCSHHFRLAAPERVAFLLDPDSFNEIDANLESVDILNFVSMGKSYQDKLKEAQIQAHAKEAVLSGIGTLESQPVALAVLEFSFIGASMGSVVGEKITRLIETALERRLPLIIVSASGGARMHEGLFSLLQMAKTTAALARFGEARLPYFSVLTDPTTGGVSASFAFLGDVNIAEPGALIGFAGPRVIEQLTHQKLAVDVDTAEFQKLHGMIDLVVHRRELRPTVARLLRLYAPPHPTPWHPQNGLAAAGLYQPTLEPFPSPANPPALPPERSELTAVLPEEKR